MPRIMLREVLPWHFDQLVLLEEVQELELLIVRQLGGIVNSSRSWDADAIKVLFELVLCVWRQRLADVHAGDFSLALCLHW